MSISSLIAGSFVPRHGVSSGRRALTVSEAGAARPSYEFGNNTNRPIFVVVKGVRREQSRGAAKASKSDLDSCLQDDWMR